MVNRKIMALGLLLATGFVGAEEVVFGNGGGMFQSFHDEEPKKMVWGFEKLPVRELSTKYGIRSDHLEGFANAISLILEGMEIQTLNDERRNAFCNDLFEKFNPYFGPRGYNAGIFMDSMRGFPEMVRGSYGIKPEHVRELTNACKLILEGEEIQILTDERRESLGNELFFTFRPKSTLSSFFR